MFTERARLSIPGIGERQSILEATSYSLETRRIPDTYPLTIKLGKLYTPDGHLVEDSIEKDSIVGKLEYKAFLKIQDWASNNYGGLAIWISPPKEGVYPYSKVVLSEVAHSSASKLLVNKAILLDLSAEKCTGLFNELSNHTTTLSDSDELRSIPLLFEYVNPKQLRWMIDLILNSDAHQLAMIRNSYDINEAERTIQYFRSQEVSYGTVASNLAKHDGFIGNYSSSCPISSLTGTKMGAFETLFNNSLKTESTFPCPSCDKPIPSGHGITKCPHCGVTKEEYGSKCD